MISNLKGLNKHIEKHHFKMDTLWSAVRLMTPNYFMASIDLKDAYYVVPIAEEHRKYLRFYGRAAYTNTRACQMGFHVPLGVLLSC